MAVSLNRNRMFLSRMLVGAALLLAFLTVPAFTDDYSAPHMLLDMVGYFLLAACAIGRVYCTAFIGGAKNKKLVMEGPYSVCRNPLYFCSLLGAAGVGLLSEQVISFALIFGGFLLLYGGLISREEEYLEGKFGREFLEYKARVPRLWPDFSKFRAAEELTFQPRFLTYSLRDAVWWFAPLPLFELAEYLRHAGLVKPLLVVF